VLEQLDETDPNEKRPESSGNREGLSRMLNHEPVEIEI